MIAQRKPDPTMRENIYLSTYRKIKDFLEDQNDFIYRTRIQKQLKGIDMLSINLAINKLDEEIGIQKDKKGRIKLKKDV